MADVELDVGTFYPNKWVEGVGLTPAEPPAQLGSVENVGVAGVAGQAGDRRQLGGDMVVGWNGSSGGGMVLPRAARQKATVLARRQRGEASDHGDATPPNE